MLLGHYNGGSRMSVQDWVGYGIVFQTDLLYFQVKFWLWMHGSLPNIDGLRKAQSYWQENASTFEP